MEFPRQPPRRVAFVRWRWLGLALAVAAFACRAAPAPIRDIRVVQNGSTYVCDVEFPYATERRIEPHAPAAIHATQTRGSLQRVESLLPLEPEGAGAAEPARQSGLARAGTRVGAGLLPRKASAISNAALVNASAAAKSASDSRRAASLPR